MYRIIDNRSTGKTGRLMLLAKENNALFVCGDPHCMEQKAKAYGIEGIQFISYYDYLDTNKWRGGIQHRPVIIDELETMINHQNPYLNVIGYSISAEDN
jgi:hypothetical protein